MKGLIIHKQLEYRVETKSDGLTQGDSFSCTFSIINHGPEAESVGQLYLRLACGNIKKLKEKAGDAFSILSGAQIPSQADIAPRSRVSFEATFILDQNCPVTDKKQSLYLLFGSESSGASGEALLTVAPHRYIQPFLRSLGNPHEFEVRSIGSDEDWVQAKVKPPGLRRYMLVTELRLSARIEGGDLLLKYLFKLKNLETTESTLGIRKSTREIEQRLPIVSFHFANSDLINSEVIDSKVSEALDQVAMKI